MTKTQYIKIIFQKEGIHKFPAAASDATLATGDWDDVSHLAHPHLHYFYFTVWLEVFHSDRDIEFQQFRRWCERLYAGGGTLNLDYQSCEMISDALYEKISHQFPGRRVRIEVLEDNINGSYVEYSAI